MAGEPAPTVELGSLRARVAALSAALDAAAAREMHLRESEGRFRILAEESRALDGGEAELSPEQWLPRFQRERKGARASGAGRAGEGAAGRAAPVASHGRGNESGLEPAIRE